MFWTQADEACFKGNKIYVSCWGMNACLWRRLKTVHCNVYLCLNNVSAPINTTEVNQCLLANRWIPHAELLLSCNRNHSKVIAERSYIGNLYKGIINIALEIKTEGVTRFCCFWFASKLNEGLSIFCYSRCNWYAFNINAFSMFLSCLVTYHIG
mgnify:CR=1 FL=1